MSYQVRALAPPGIAAGFALAGLRTMEAETVQDVVDRLGELARHPAVGVILLEENRYRELPDDLRRKFGRRPLPLIVPFPGPAWTKRESTAEAYIVELLRQVVGYRVRLR